MRQLLRDRTGHATILLAASLTLLLGTAALGVDTGMMFLEKRRLQGVADAAALAAAANPAAARAAAEAAIAASPGAPVSLQALLSGDYNADAAVAPASRFTSNTAGDAVQVTVLSRAPQLFGRALGFSAPTDIVARASATRVALAGFSIGSRVAAVQGGLPNAMLSALAGTDLRLTVLDYQGLAGAHIDLLGFITALRTQAKLEGATFTDVLTASVTLPQVLRAMAAATEPAAAPILTALAGRVPASTVPLNDLIDLGPLGANLRAGDAAPVSVEAVSLLRATLEASNGNRIAVGDVALAIPGLSNTRVQLAVGARASHSPFVAISATRRITIRTSQTRLYIDTQLTGAAPLGLGAIRVPLYVDLAPAEATLTAVSCAAGRANATASLDVTPSLGSVAIADVDGTIGDFSRTLTLRPATVVRTPLASATAFADLQLGRRTRPVSFTALEITGATPKTVATDDLTTAIVGSLMSRLTLQASVLGLGLDTGGITAALRPVLTQAAGPLDTLLAQVSALSGVGVGQADVWMNGVRCGTPVLIG